MKKNILRFFIAAGLSQGLANECTWQEPSVHQSYSYMTFGVGPLPVPAPSIGAGTRDVMSENSALDMGVNISSIIYVTTIRGYVNYLKYFNQKPSSQCYWGIGGSLGAGTVLIYCPFAYVAPNFIGGVEFLNRNGKKRFFQVEAMYPACLVGVIPDGKCGGICPFPLLTISYGVAF